MTEGVVSQVINSLEGDELVIRKSDPRDARIRRVRITPKGRRLRKKLIALGMGLVEDVSADLSSEHALLVIEMLISLRLELDKMIESHEKS